VAEEGIARVPYWIYPTRRLRASRSACFAGELGASVALEAEFRGGDFKRTFIGDKPVVVVRDEDGSSTSSRTAARTAAFSSASGTSATPPSSCALTTMTYDLKGNLIGVPFRRGVKKQGGMPADFDPKNHGLRKPAVARAQRRDLAPSPRAAAARGYWDPRCSRCTTASSRTRAPAARILAPANPGELELMFENIKDPYHASLLHVFLVSFGLFRADQPSKTEMDSTGRHGALISWRGEQKKTDDTPT